MHLFIVYNTLIKSLNYVRWFVLSSDQTRDSIIVKALTHELTKILLYFILKSPPLTPGPQTPPEQKAHAVPVAPA